MSISTTKNTISIISILTIIGLVVAILNDGTGFYEWIKSKFKTEEKYEGKPSPPPSREIIVQDEGTYIEGNQTIIYEKGSIIDPNKETILPSILDETNLYHLAERITSTNIRRGNARIVSIPGIKPYFVTLTKAVNTQDRESSYVFQSYKYHNENWALSASDTLLSYNFDVVGELAMYSNTRKVDEFYDYESKNAIVFSGCITHQCDKTFGFYCYFPEIDKGYMAGVDHIENVVKPVALFNDPERMEYFNELLVLENKILRTNRGAIFPELSNGYKKFIRELPTSRVYPNHRSEYYEDEINKIDRFVRSNITGEHDDIFGLFYGDFFNTGEIWYSVQLVKLEYYDRDKYIIDWSRFVFINSDKNDEYFILEGDGYRGVNDILTGDYFKIFSYNDRKEKIFGFLSEDSGGKVPTYYLLAYTYANGKISKIKDDEVCKSVWNKYGNPKYYFNCI